MIPYIKPLTIGATFKATPLLVIGTLSSLFQFLAASPLLMCIHKGYSTPQIIFVITPIIIAGIIENGGPKNFSIQFLIISLKERLLSFLDFL